MSASASLPPHDGRIRVATLFAIIPLFMGGVGYFGFPQLYGLWCELTASGMSYTNASAIAGVGKDTSPVEVIFNQHATNLPVTFHAQKRIVHLQRGASADNMFHFTNHSNRPITFRPVHSVTPIAAQAAFHLELCWCFQQQTIPPGESRDFPMRFRFGQEMDERVSGATITYTLYEVKP